MINDLLDRKPKLVTPPAKQWRNRWFLIDGDSLCGGFVHPTKEIAEEVGSNWFAYVQDRIASGSILVVPWKGHVILATSLSHFKSEPVED